MKLFKRPIHKFFGIKEQNDTIDKAPNQSFCPENM